MHFAKPNHQMSNIQEMRPQLARQDRNQWLPTSKKEVEARGWDELDVILFSGDAYVDHPSFGIAVIGRVLESIGLRVAIIPQPNWRDDLRDFKKLGAPRLFFGVSAGSMDSMVNRYTATKRIRSEDAYTPDRRNDMRPDYPTIVYSTILKELFPETPVVIGGIEASLRRLTHYDYWQDALRPSILTDSKADLLIYGMGETPIKDIANRLKEGQHISTLTDIPQTSYLYPTANISSKEGDINLFSHEECMAKKMCQIENFKRFEIESNRMNASARILQPIGEKTIVINPPNPLMSQEELDEVYALPFTRLPHPKYGDKVIPAYEMIKHSVTLHRGCFGGCSFCTISAHQGKHIASRSKESVLREVKQIIAMRDFKGYISDLGGPSANMYRMAGVDQRLCNQCTKPSCLHPRVCSNLGANHRPLIEIYRSVDKHPEIKRSFVGSGIRYDLLLHPYNDSEWAQAAQTYTRELIANHVSGRLKVAPEHTQPGVLAMMRKPSFEQFKAFNKLFVQINKEKKLNQQLIPYFISGHPGCSDVDMAELAIETKAMGYQLEQVQEFTPTPMTLAAEMFYSGYDPYNQRPIYSAKGRDQKLMQRAFFFWRDPQQRAMIVKKLNQLQRSDLIRKLFGEEQRSNNHTPRNARKYSDNDQRRPYNSGQRKADNEDQRRSYGEQQRNYKPSARDPHVTSRDERRGSKQPANDQRKPKRRY